MNKIRMFFITYKDIHLSSEECFRYFLLFNKIELMRMKLQCGHHFSIVCVMETNFAKHYRKMLVM